MKSIHKLSLLIAIFWSLTTFAYANPSISLKQLILASASQDTLADLIDKPIQNNKEKRILLSLQNNENGTISLTQSLLKVQTNNTGDSNQIQLTIDKLGEKLEESNDPLFLNHALYTYFINQDLDTTLIKNTSVAPFYSSGVYKISQQSQKDVWVVLQNTISNHKNSSLISIYSNEKDALKQYSKPFYG